MTTITLRGTGLHRRNGWRIGIGACFPTAPEDIPLTGPVAQLVVIGPNDEQTEDEWVAQDSRITFDSSTWQVMDIVPSEPNGRDRTVVLQQSSTDA